MSRGVLRERRGAVENLDTLQTHREKGERISQLAYTTDDGWTLRGDEDSLRARLERGLEVLQSEDLKHGYRSDFGASAVWADSRLGAPSETNEEPVNRST